MVASAPTPNFFTKRIIHPLGFTKTYNFWLYFIFGGALVGFALARVSYLDFSRNFCPSSGPSSSGNGAAPHLATEMVARSAGVKFLHVPYKGVGPALTALLGNEVQFSVADVGAVPHIRAGKLRALAVLSARPSELIPGAPGMAQAGFKDVDISSNLGIMAPAGTPADVVAKLNAAGRQAAQAPAFTQRLSDLGYGIVGNTSPEQMGSMIQDEVKRWAPIVKASGAKID